MKLSKNNPKKATCMTGNALMKLMFWKNAPFLYFPFCIGHLSAMDDFANESRKVYAIFTQSRCGFK